MAQELAMRYHSQMYMGEAGVTFMPTRWPAIDDVRKKYGSGSDAGNVDLRRGEQ